MSSNQAACVGLKKKLSSLWRPCTFHNGGVNKAPGSSSKETEGSVECHGPVFIYLEFVDSARF